jgi:hypothetical protein
MAPLIALALTSGLLQEVPADVAQGQLEAALGAGVEAGPGAISAADPLTLSPVLIFVLVVALSVLFLLRRLDGGPAPVRWGGHVEVLRPQDSAPDEPGRPERPARTPPKPEAVPLPPHVAAMLQRVSERRASSAPSASRPDAPDDEPGDDGNPPPFGHLDLWVS